MEDIKQHLIVGDLVEFVLKHRKGKVWLGWTREQLAQEIALAANRNSLSFIAKADGTVEGLVVFEEAPSYKLIHINNILTIRKGIIKLFCMAFKSRYPGWDIQGNRRDYLVRYKDTTKLIDKLMTKGNI